MTEFFRFPRTPHLAWLGEGEARGDKVLSPQQVTDLLSHTVVVEEKLDGANIGISVDEKGELRAQNRGQYLSPDVRHPQFGPLFSWLGAHRHALVDSLGENRILFGEWCYAVHSARYDKLPDWFLAFDVYDRSKEDFWSTARRDRFVQGIGLDLVPRVAEGRFDLAALGRMLGPSRVGDGPAEGIYVRVDQGERLQARAKLVRPQFTQSIGEHWSRRPLRTNALARSAG